MASLPISACHTPGVCRCGCARKIVASDHNVAAVIPTESSVKRQSIGNCWIYASVGWVESLHLRATGEVYDLSETYVSYWDWYEKLVKDYYGPDYVLGPNDAVEWAYIPHFYYKYYVFSYAWGLSSGLALAEKVAGGDAKPYLDMLKSGAAKSPAGSRRTWSSCDPSACRAERR